MSTFLQLGSLSAAGSGFINPSSIISIVFTSTTVLTVTISSAGADVLTITLSSADNAYETHRVLADAFISSAQGGTVYQQLPSALPGGRTFTFALA